MERAASEGSEEADDEGAQLVVLDPDHVRTCPRVSLWPCVGENHLGPSLHPHKRPVLSALSGSLRGS